MLMDRCFHILLDGVHRFEGTVNQFTDDGIMALFGAPIAHEDHPRRAVLAALEMQAALSAYRQELSRQQGIDLKLRIGVNTGEVVVAAIGDNLRMDYTAQGLTTNLAARLEAMAPPGGVLLSEKTYRHIEEYFHCQDLGAVQVKGRSQPVHLYQALGVRKWRGPLDEGEGRYLTRLVGRNRELHFLQGLLERAKRGQGQVASVVGEPGMGKTHIPADLVVTP
jgi:class 3 adenylate cyclase